MKLLDNNPFLALMMLVLALPEGAQASELGGPGTLLDRVVAVVNDGIVLESELDAQLTLISQRLQSQQQELPPENVLREQVLERLVLQEIQMQRAKRLGVNVPDEAVNNALREIGERNGLTLAQLPAAMAAQGVDYASYRSGIRTEMTLNLLRQRDVLARINISPRELDRYMEKRAAQPSQSAEYNVSHILIAVPEAAAPEDIARVTARAEDVHRRAAAGEDFAKLAISYSNSQTALEGGELGWRKGTELPTFLEDVIVKLEPGQVSELLRTPSGFHLVRLNERRGVGAGSAVEQQSHTRHILLKPNELQDDATVAQRLRDIRARIVNGEDFAGIAKTVSEDVGSAANGGDLGWNPGGTFVPEFEAQLAKLGENEISEPFRTQFGWHIVQLLGKRSIDNSDEIKRRQAMQELVMSKADDETELWLRRLRDEAYVDLRL
ncbi:MAG: peptidylprolyl isomerase [Steroidobacteraceae bacterium]